MTVEPKELAPGSRLVRIGSISYFGINNHEYAAVI